MDVLHIKQFDELFQILNLIEKDLNLKGLEPHWNNITLNISQWQIQDFPLGGAEPLGGTNLQRGNFLAKMYAKMKELDPVGGVCAGGAPRSTNVSVLSSIRTLMRQLSCA